VTQDPEFTTLLIRVAIVGGTIGVIGATVLFFAFRAFRDRGARPPLLVVVLLVFVLLCCAVLLRWSLVR
jgi:lipopolysaccharide export LptBFGC system permease protein LptF